MRTFLSNSVRVSYYEFLTPRGRHPYGDALWASKTYMVTPYVVGVVEWSKSPGNLFPDPNNMGSNPPTAVFP